MSIIEKMKIRKICRKILTEKGKSKKVVMTEFINRNKK